MTYCTTELFSMFSTIYMYVWILSMIFSISYIMQVAELWYTHPFIWSRLIIFSNLFSTPCHNVSKAPVIAYLSYHVLLVSETCVCVRIRLTFDIDLLFNRCEFQCWYYTGQLVQYCTNICTDSYVIKGFLSPPIPSKPLVHTLHAQGRASFHSYMMNWCWPMAK